MQYETPQENYIAAMCEAGDKMSPVFLNIDISPLRLCCLEKTYRFETFPCVWDCIFLFR